ncbi:MAG: peptidylprolyl isomerase [Gemmatimonadota bacterium]|nr:peptidylprolyl isomerase [Gemmatimonadota bacterium]MDE2983699.1 peptidylprolyl isomerase [Gemmatimonadota bacterium]
MGTVRLGSVRLRTGERARLAVLALAPLLASCADTPPPPSAAQVAYAEIVAEEDARGDIGFERVRAHLESEDPVVRAMAVRALGRQEDAGRLAQVGEMLDDPNPAVRMAAAAALAQSAPSLAPLPPSVRPADVQGPVELLAPTPDEQAASGPDSDRDDGAAVLPLLAARIGQETDPGVVGALATNLGRLPFTGAEHRAARGAALAAAWRRLGELAADRDPLALAGLARGIETFARSAGPEDVVARELVEVARSLLETGGESSGDPASARVRRLAAAALTHAGELAGEDLAGLLEDADWGVRRQAMIAAARQGAAASGVISAGLGDPDARVRVEALRAHGERESRGEGCLAILLALDDSDPDVVATALDLVAGACQSYRGPAITNLEAVLDGRDGDWRSRARALFALAGIAPDEAGDHIRRFAGDGNPFVRAWAARAAGRAGEAEVLRGLAGDEDPNVREAALQGLGEVVGGDGRDAYLAALESDDPQLVMTASRLLSRHAAEETPVSALLASLARFTSARRETERDVRVALLVAIGEVGGFSAGDLTPYLADFDDVVRNLAANWLFESTGTVHETTGTSLPHTPTPDAARIAELAGTQVILHMADLGAIVIRLRPDLAATNADRFARLAAEGYFDGLTFHRVVPNFVIQGGSPHANEYMGDGPYSRDEISDHPHWRGTVGLSTRGRDTGDAQIFINLVDNVRLDFNYTIYGEVVDGMEVVDAVQEGAVIERAEVITP